MATRTTAGPPSADKADHAKQIALLQLGGQQQPQQEPAAIRRQLHSKNHPSTARGAQELHYDKRGDKKGLHGQTLVVPSKTIGGHRLWIGQHPQTRS